MLACCVVGETFCRPGERGAVDPARHKNRLLALPGTKQARRDVYDNVLQSFPMWKIMSRPVGKAWPIWTVIVTAAMRHVLTLNRRSQPFARILKGKDGVADNGAAEASNGADEVRNFSEAYFAVTCILHAQELLPYRGFHVGGPMAIAPCRVIGGDARRQYGCTLQ